jgi:8-oxo-dGTP pyrophosphatase MutT (NUDIX family)
MTGLMQRLIAQAHRFAASGATPVTPRLAATVVLLRSTSPGVEVYLLRRAVSMAFASGMYAFPGGAVDPADVDGETLSSRWSTRLGRPQPEAETVVRAAVRELAEETGVRLGASDLHPWTRWITPEFEPRRYDTYFFVAGLPDGQDAADISGEADRTEWLAPAAALARMQAGDIVMLPPTSVTLGDLVGFGSVAEVLAASEERDAASPVLPRVERGPDGADRLVF